MKLVSQPLAPTISVVSIVTTVAALDIAAVTIADIKVANVLGVEAVLVGLVGGLLAVRRSGPSPAAEPRSERSSHRNHLAIQQHERGRA